MNSRCYASHVKKIEYINKLNLVVELDLKKLTSKALTEENPNNEVDKFKQCLC